MMESTYTQAQLYSALIASGFDVKIVSPFRMIVSNGLSGFGWLGLAVDTLGPLIRGVREEGVGADCIKKQLMVISEYFRAA